jgi:hypothetical protein
LPTELETPAASALPPISRRGMLGIAWIALAILMFEIALTRVLSVVMWYHFAVVVISLAMLGLAIAGIALYFIPGLVRSAAAVIPWFSRLAGVTAGAALVYLAHNPFKTEAAGGIFSADVAVFYAVALAPFLFGGLAISAALARYARQVNTLYFADLLGAGVGCVVVVLLLKFVGAPAAILLACAAFFVGAMLLRRAGSSAAFDTALVVVAVGCAIWAFQAQESSGRDADDPVRFPFEPRYQKGLADRDTGNKPHFLGWNSHSRIKVIEPRGAASIRVISIDETATTEIREIKGDATPETVADQVRDARWWTGATPYAILPERPRVLIIGPGGGRDVLTGIVYRADVTAVELNGLIIKLMKGRFAAWSGHVYTALGVNVIHDEARSWVRRSNQKFDLIQATLVDTWAATSAGAFTLAENALYTVEAFADYWDHLTEDGVVHITRWHRDPPRESLRAIVLMTDVMKERGVPNPERHVIAAVDRQGTDGANHPFSMLLWSRRELSEERLAKLVQYSEVRKRENPGFVLDPLYVPTLPSATAIGDIGKYLRSPNREEFVDTYPYDIRASTDDRPFFFNTVRLSEILDPRFRQELYQNEQAVVVLGTILVTVLGIVVAAFLIPFGLTLPRIRRSSGPGTGASLLYFCGLGAGFMLVEMPVLQRFGLYLGHPTYALSTILATLLVATGVGSALAGWWLRRHPVGGARVALVLVIVAIGALVLVVPQVLSQTLGLGIWFRVLITMALLFPLGVLMGFPLPLGIRALAGGREAMIPWAWGMNGATSVLASILGVAIGMYAGFTVALLVGAAFYALAFFMAGRLVPDVVTPAEVIPVEPPPVPPPPAEPIPMS